MINIDNSQRKIVIGVVVIGILGVILIQSYAQRSLQGRIRSASADLGSTMQYEPYYSNPEGAKQQSAQNVLVSMTRKIIKNAQLNLKVKDGAQFMQDAKRLAGEFNGITLNSKLNKSSQDAQSGSFIFKVPPANLEAVLQKIRGLGELESEDITGEDVTEQYVDLSARLENWRLVKNRLVKVLDERAREVKDILEIERELARVGGEIESLEGRMKYLDRQVDLSTVTVYFHQTSHGITGLVNIGDSFRSTITTGVNTAISTFNGLIVFVFFLLPIGFWLGIAWGVIFLVRKFLIKDQK